MLDNMLKNSREQVKEEEIVVEKTDIVNEKKHKKTIENKGKHISTNVNNGKQIKKTESEIIELVTLVDTSQQVTTNVNNSKQIGKQEGEITELGATVGNRQQLSTNVNKLINEIINSPNAVLPKNVQRKTFYLKPEILRMFKYIKRNKRIGESEFINFALEKIFYDEFGKNWNELE